LQNIDHTGLNGFITAQLFIAAPRSIHWRLDEHIFPGVLSHLASNLKTIHVGQAQVEKDDLRFE
jgi:hypothetical protein